MNDVERIRWLDENPPEEEISLNPDASEFLDIVVVENLLTELDSFWGTENFKSRVFQINDSWFGSASLELVVSYSGKTRRIVGAATLKVAPNDLGEIDITHLEPTLASECKKNGSKKLGRRFGKYLNDRGQTQVATTTKSKREKRPAVLMIADERIRTQYRHAKELGNDKLVLTLESIYDKSTLLNA